MRIQDYEIPQDVDSFELELPEGSRILNAKQTMLGAAILVIEDPGAARTTKRFIVVNTDHDREELATPVTYLGTFQVQGGVVLRHVFQLPKGS